MAKRKDEKGIAKSIINEIIDFTENEETKSQKLARQRGKAGAAKLTAASRSAMDTTRFFCFS